MKGEGKVMKHGIINKAWIIRTLLFGAMAVMMSILLVIMVYALALDVNKKEPASAKVEEKSYNNEVGEREVNDLNNTENAPETEDVFEAEEMVDNEENDQEDFVIEWKDEKVQDVMRKVTGITDREIMMSDVSKIEKLDISYSDIDDLSFLSYLPHLKELDISQTNVTDISVLKELPALEKLRLYDTNIIDIGALVYLPNIKSLYLNYIDGLDLNVLKELSMLEELSISVKKNTEIETKNFEVIGYLNNLRYLGLVGDFDDISFLSNLTSLQELYFIGDIFEYIRSGGSSEAIDFSSLSNLLNLKKLTLVGAKVKDISALANLQNLEYLFLGDFSRCIYSSVSDISPLENLVNLKSLYLTSLVQIRNTEVLSNLINLEVLNLSYNKIEDISMVHNLVNLKELYLSDNALTDISSLNNLTRLERLDLSRNEITDISSLENLTNLKYINLSENPISDYSSVSFVESLYTDIEKEVLRIRDIYYQITDEISGDQLNALTITDGVVAYQAGDNVQAIFVNRGIDGYDYSRKYYFDDNQLIFAYYESSDAHRLYFKNDKLIRWRYSPVASNPQDAENHDGEYVDGYLELEDYAVLESYSLLRDVEAIS